MSLSILNNVSSLAAQNQLSMTQASLQKTLLQLSSGSRLNSGADDAAGLAIADGLHANITALTQSARNASDGMKAAIGRSGTSSVGNSSKAAAASSRPSHWCRASPLRR